MTVDGSSFSQPVHCKSLLKPFALPCARSVRCFVGRTLNSETPGGRRFSKVAECDGPKYKFWAIRCSGAIVALMVAGCASSPDLEVSRKFQTAEEAFASATSPTDFTRVASLYQEILDSGFESGAVLYNQGNAWMQAGEMGRAIASYRRAQRYLPRDPYLDANLRQAVAGHPQQPATPLLNYLFFWQTSVSYLEKAVLTTAFLATTLVLALLIQTGWHTVFVKRIAPVAAIVTLLMLTSLLRDWYNFEHVQHGVIVAKETMARKGSSDSYEPAFNQPLTEGTEGIVLQHHNSWVNINIAGIGTGWIPSRDCVTY